MMYGNQQQKMKGRKEQQHYDFMVKVVIIGDSAVGKTNILLRFVNDQYKMAHITTIGVDFKIKIVSIEGVKIKMQIWDTAGQQRFKTITQTYYKGASGVLLVYAVNDKKTFTSIESWLKQINQVQPQGISKILIGNKSDLPDSQRQISKQEGQSLAKKYGIPFYETSAKDNINIAQIFYQVGKLMKQWLDQSQSHERNAGGVMIERKNDGNRGDNQKKNCQC